MATIQHVRAEPVKSTLLRRGRRALGALAALAALFGAASSALADKITYYHNDLLGSPMAATDENRQVLWRETYLPYGERQQADPESLPNKIRYTSRHQDDDTGLIYMGARYYDPLAGRFLSVDAMGFSEANVHSFNRYAYANNNPYRYSDPDGRVPVLVIIWAVVKAAAISGGTGALVHTSADAVSQAVAFGIVDWKGAAKEGLNAAPAWALGAGAGEAIGAGAVAYSAASSAASSAARAGAAAGKSFFEGTRYSQKVVEQMRRGAGEFHSFPESVVAFEKSGTVRTITGGDGVLREMLEIPGSYGPRNGVFQFIKDADGTINHRLFVPSP